MTTGAFKIGLLSIGGMRIADSVHSPIDLSTDKVPITAYIGQSAKKRAKQLLDNSDLWRQWKGLIWEKVIDPNVLVEARIPTKTPELLDAQNEMLDEELGKAAIALQIATPAGAQNWFILTGTEGEAPRGYRQLSRWVPPHPDFLPEKQQWKLLGNPYLGSETQLTEYDDNVLLHLTDNSCKIWPQLACAIRKVEKEDSLKRLRDGILVFHNACLKEQPNFRVPLFVRSLEALVALRRGEGEKKFVERTSRWWPRSSLSFLSVSQEEEKKEIGRIWKLRSDCTHMNMADSNWSKNDQLRLAFECEAIARTAYKEVLLNEDKLKRVKNWWQ